MATGQRQSLSTTRTRRLRHRLALARCVHHRPSSPPLTWSPQASTSLFVPYWSRTHSKQPAPFCKVFYRTRSPAPPRRRNRSQNLLHRDIGTNARRARMPRARRAFVAQRQASSHEIYHCLVHPPLPVVAPSNPRRHPCSSIRPSTPTFCTHTPQASAPHRPRLHQARLHHQHLL